MKENFIKSKQKVHFLSIIVPAYKAEDFITSNLANIREVLDQMRYPYELICVVDGWIDKTFQEAQKLARDFPDKIKVVGYENNLGKGHAVRYGMARAKGDVIGFIDAGVDINPNGLSMLLEHFEWYDADIIVGSKRHPASKVIYPWQRKILSFGYQTMVRILFGLKVKDTQVGLKFYKRKVLEDVLPRVLVKEYAFDVEILAVARSLGYKRIFEAPIEMDMKFGNSISTFLSKGFMRMSFLMMWDTLAVFYRLKILHYYDDSNMKNWITPDYLTLNHKK